MKNLLITGNVASLASHLCQRLSRQYRVTIAAGNIPPLAKGQGIETVPLLGAEALKSIFQAHSFGAMVFLATRGEQTTALSGEADLLSSALALAKSHHVDRVVYIASGELSREAEAKGERGMLLQAMEQLCASYRAQGLDVTVLRLPLLFGPGETDTLIGRMLLAAARGEGTSVPFSKEAQADFISVADAAHLVASLLEKREDSPALVQVRGPEALTGSELRALFGLLGAEVTQGPEGAGYPPMEAQGLAEIGFTPVERLSVALDRLYAAAKAALEKQGMAKRRVRSFFSRHPGIWRGLTVLAGYGIVEYLQAVQAGGQLPPLDFRLLYVALMGAAHGLQSGLFAAVLACFSIARGYGAQGMDISLLWKDWQAWLPIAAVVLAGIAAGYGRDKGKRELRSSRDTVATLEKRCAFLQDLYKQALLAPTAAPAPKAEDEMEAKLAQLRLGQERLEREWLALLNREQEKWDRETAAETHHTVSFEHAGAAEKAPPKAEAAPAQEKEAGEGQGKKVWKAPAAIRLEDAQEEVSVSNAEEDGLSLFEEVLLPVEEEYPLRPGKSKKRRRKEELQKARMALQAQRERQQAESGEAPAESPFGRMSPAERRRMLEAMQVASGAEAPGPEEKNG